MHTALSAGKLPPDGCLSIQDRQGVSRVVSLSDLSQIKEGYKKLYVQPRVITPLQAHKLLPKIVSDKLILLLCVERRLRNNPGKVAGAEVQLQVSSLPILPMELWLLVLRCLNGADLETAQPQPDPFNNDDFDIVADFDAYQRSIQSGGGFPLLPDT